MAAGGQRVKTLQEVDYGCNRATIRTYLIDEDRAPRIVGTTTKVIALVLDRQAYGWSPEELHYQHPHLALGQIHAALAYYWDHRAELDQDIQRRLRHFPPICHT